MQKASQRQVNHAALAYLNLWARTDEEHLRRLQESNPDHLDRVAATHAIASKYRVARGFSSHRRLSRKKVDPDKNHAFWEEVLLLVVSAPEDDHVAVEELAVTLGRHGQSRSGTPKLLRSVATKLLWFSGRQNVRIYDRQALAALGWGPNESVPYPEFHSVWNEAARIHSDQLASAMSQLSADSGLLDWSAVAAGEDNAAADAIASPWFRDRVFDQVLWARGKPIAGDRDDSDEAEA